MPTEDETIRKLKQSPFSVVLEDMNKNGYSPLVLKKHYWTNTEYMNQIRLHYRIEDVELD